MAATNATNLTRTHRILIGVVVAGAIVIAAIGFAGSYSAVRDLAEKKGFGTFSAVFPIGIDAGIVVLLALDLLLTWIRIPFPLLRQTAWLLTIATIAFNGAAAWPDPLGVGMHAVIPVLFVVAVEAARHAIGRIADITADRHMESVRITRWLLAFPSTFRLWRRMKLWELRSYDEVIKLEQDRLVYQARLRARYGRAWRRKAPVESRMPLKLARYGIPLAETAAAGLAAAGISVPRPPAEAAGAERQPAVGPGTGDRAVPALTRGTAEDQALRASGPASRPEYDGTAQNAERQDAAAYDTAQQATAYGNTAQQATAAYGTAQEPAAYGTPPGADGAPATGQAPGPVSGPATGPASGPADTRQVTVPVSPGRVRALGNAQTNGYSGGGPSPYIPPQSTTASAAYEQELFVEPLPGAGSEAEGPVTGLPDDVPHDEAIFAAYRQYVAEKGDFPDSRHLARYLLDVYGVRGPTGGPLSEAYLRRYTREFRDRLRMEMQTEHTP
ncbi:DUF2637 domain-containing protein [Streptomyces sp. NPDC004647]|uniref:DUF2637 domain-containing protein n=1 Tax=Streptomyces sp. NPDC004647 TaxID=3154671 RepID=UPI0033A6437C